MNKRVRNQRLHTADDVRDDVIEAAEADTTVEGCAWAAGVSTTTLYDWLD